MIFAPVVLCVLSPGQQVPQGVTTEEQDLAVYQQVALMEQSDVLWALLMRKLDALASWEVRLTLVSFLLASSRTYALPG